MKFNLLLFVFALTVSGLSHAAQTNPSLDGLDQFVGDYSSPQYEPNHVCQHNLRVSREANSIAATTDLGGGYLVSAFDFEKIGDAPETYIQKDSWGAKFKITRWRSFDPSTLTVSAHEIRRQYVLGFPGSPVELIQNMSVDPVSHVLRLIDTDSQHYIYSDCTYLSR